MNSSQRYEIKSLCDSNRDPERLGPCQPHPPFETKWPIAQEVEQKREGITKVVLVVGNDAYYITNIISAVSHVSRINVLLSTFKVFFVGGGGPLPKISA